VILELSVEDRKEKENDEVLADFAFPPYNVTTIVLSRSMANQLKDREHHEKGFHSDVPAAELTR
jgi:hypothetical protein